MAGNNGFQPTKPVTEKKKRKRPSKKVPTTVLESSSTNFMDLVQKLTGSAAELASDSAAGEIKRPKAAAAATPVVAENSFQSYLHNVIYNADNNNDSTSSSSQQSNHSSPAPGGFPGHFMDPILGGLGADEELYHHAGLINSSTSRAAENDLSLFSSGSWRDHSEFWYHMDAMRA